MKKIFIIAISLLLYTFSTIAQVQSGSSITGKLIDKDTEEPIALANIRILQRADSTFVTGKASNTEGVFTIPVRNGSYILHISFIGYNDIYRDVQVTSSRPDVQWVNHPVTTIFFCRRQWSPPRHR